MHIPQHIQLFRLTSHLTAESKEELIFQMPLILNGYYC